MPAAARGVPRRRLETQKITKIGNLLSKWKGKGLIVNKGSDRVPRWVLAEKKE
jgi:hypothetical protein